jgi:hypothetical protein
MHIFARDTDATECGGGRRRLENPEKCIKLYVNISNLATCRLFWKKEFNCLHNEKCFDNFSQRFTPVSAEFVHFLLQLSTRVIFAIFAYCHICSYAAKNSSCVCILKTPPWKKERAAILCIKSEKVAAVCLALKRHLGPLPADTFWPVGNTLTHFGTPTF